MRGERRRDVRGIEGEELGSEFGEVDFLSVGASIGFCRPGRGGFLAWENAVGRGGGGAEVRGRDGMRGLGEEIQGREGREGRHTFAEHHGPGEVLNRFFDYVGEHQHDGTGLILGKPLVLKTLDEL